MEENWKEIPSAKNYEVSDLGRIRRRVGGQGCRKGWILKPEKNKTGYWQTVLRNNGKSGMVYIHWKVAETWLGSRPFHHDINHKNRNRDDNRLINLEYLHRSINRAVKV